MTPRDGTRRERRLVNRARGRKDAWRSASPRLPAGVLQGSYLTAEEIQLFLREFGVGKSHNISKKSFQGRKLFRIIKFYLYSTQILEWHSVNSFPCLVPEECIQLLAIIIQLHKKKIFGFLTSETDMSSSAFSQRLHFLNFSKSFSMLSPPYQERGGWCSNAQCQPLWTSFWLLWLPVFL